MKIVDRAAATAHYIRASFEKRDHKFIPRFQEIEKICGMLGNEGGGKGEESGEKRYKEIMAVQLLEIEFCLRHIRGVLLGLLALEIGKFIAGLF